MASTSATTSNNSPCAGCKFLRRKCQPGCVFAPHFPPDQPQKFASVHKIFGASNVTKLLNELHPSQREDAANSLAYEADMRVRDPVYGCVGVISLLQHQLRQLQMDLCRAKSELSKYHHQGNLHLINYYPVMPVNSNHVDGHNYYNHQHQNQQQVIMRGFDGLNNYDNVGMAATPVNGQSRVTVATTVEHDLRGERPP